MKQMNQVLKNDIIKILNEVEALKLCIVNIDRELGMTISEINKSSHRFSISSNPSHAINFAETFKDSLEDCSDTAARILMESNLKISDIAQIDNALREIVKLKWEPGTFIYTK